MVDEAATFSPDPLPLFGEGAGKRIPHRRSVERALALLSTRELERVLAAVLNDLPLETRSLLGFRLATITGTTGTFPFVNGNVPYLSRVLAAMLRTDGVDVLDRVFTDDLLGAEHGVRAALAALVTALVEAAAGAP